MQPEIVLDTAIVAANARAWRSFAGVPVYAVVKANGYRWGCADLVRALDGTAQAFCVANAGELDELRTHTTSPAIVLGDVPSDRLAIVLAQNALANIRNGDELAIAARVAAECKRPLRVRVGLRPAAAWSGLSSQELLEFAPLLARSGAAIELWSHVTDLQNGDRDRRALEYAVHTLQAAGARSIETDLASTFVLARYGANENAVRIGAGLFGATGGRRISGVRCALRVVAPIVRFERLPAGSRIGYGGENLECDDDLVTVRCGYGDGLPAGLRGYGGILSIGMQYTTLRASLARRTADAIELLGEATDLDALAAHANRPAHDVITALGNAASARAVRPRS